MAHVRVTAVCPDLGSGSTVGALPSSKKKGLSEKSSKAQKAEHPHAGVPHPPVAVAAKNGQPSTSFQSLAAALPRWILEAKTPFSVYLAKTFQFQRGGSDSSVVFPLRLADVGLFRGGVPKLSRRRWIDVAKEEWCIGEIEPAEHVTIGPAQNHPPLEPSSIEPVRPPAVVLKARPKITSKPPVKADVRDRVETTSTASGSAIAPKARPTSERSRADATAATSTPTEQSKPSERATPAVASHTPENTNISSSNQNTATIDLTDQTSAPSDNLWRGYTGGLADVRDNVVGGETRRTPREPSYPPPLTPREPSHPPPPSPCGGAPSSAN